MTDAERVDERAERSFKPYSAYKDSGVICLGQMPGEWRLDRAKLLFREVDDRSEAGDETLLSVSEYRGVVPRGEMIEEGDFLSRAESLKGYRRCRTGDLVMNIMLAWKTGLGFATCDGIVSPAYSVFRLLDEGGEPRFFDYLLRSREYVSEFRRWSYGIVDSRLRLYPEVFLRLPILVPTRIEQRAIAAFLDRETAKIDALVAKKERLIELLQEKRSALITRVVTKGLDPNVKMKESGVKWLGEIPAHWDFQRIKWVARMESGHTPDKKVDSYWQDGDIPWVSLADTAQLRRIDYIVDTAAMPTLDGIAHSSAHILPRGTVVFSRDATIGLCAITAAEMAVSQHFIGWVCGPRLMPEYLLFALRSMTQELERLTMGATLRTIGMPDVRRLVAPIPPLWEQVEIVEHIRNFRSQLDSLIAYVGVAIDRLKELRTGLISAAVTGMIDVRQEVA